MSWFRSSRIKQGHLRATSWFWPLDGSSWVPRLLPCSAETAWSFNWLIHLWEIHGIPSGKLVNVDRTDGKIITFNGKTHYFYGHVQYVAKCYTVITRGSMGTKAILAWKILNGSSPLWLFLSTPTAGHFWASKIHVFNMEPRFVGDIRST